MAAAFVVCTKLENGSGDSASASVTATASNALIMAAADFNSTTISPTYTVSGGGTWTTDDTVAWNAASGYVIGYASTPSATGGTNTVTAAFTAGVAITAFCLEFSGMATINILDAAGTTNTGTVSPESSQSQTNSNATDVMLASAFDGLSTGGSYGAASNSWAIPTNGSETNNNFITGWTAYKIVSVSAGQSTSVAVTGTTLDWYSLIMAYKQASGGAATTVQPPMRTMRGAGI